MDVGIGLPSTVPGTGAAALTAWARRADEGPFASVAVLDRVRYDSYDPLVALTAAAAVTQRVRLVTSILIAPLRETSTLAKQVASLDALSGGRVTLGLGLGARGDDYELNDLGRRGRGERLGQQVDRLRGLWDEAAVTPTAAPREAPQVLLGGASGPALARMARHADGWIFQGGPPRAYAQQAATATAAWRDLGRPGEPARWAMAYYALDGAADAGRAYLAEYYAFVGPFALRIADGLLATALDVRAFVQAYADLGCDHLLLYPAVNDPDQVDRLAGALP